MMELKGKYQKDISFMLGILSFLCFLGWGLFVLLLLNTSKDKESLKTFSSVLPYIVTTIVTTIVGTIAIIYTLKIYPIKESQNEFEKLRAEKALEIINKEFETKKKVFNEIEVHTAEIASKISDALVKDPEWFDRYMDEIGATFSASIFGKRFRHFYYEKKKIAEHAINKTTKIVDSDSENKTFFLIIESGTTMFSLFPAITRHLEDKDIRNKWKERICIITNNIPGAQYLMKNCKENPLSDHSKMAVNCFLMPGIVNSNLAATECNNDLFTKAFEFLEKHKFGNKKHEVIGFLTGHHIVPYVDENKNKYFYPVTREEIHKTIKEQIVEKSQKIFLIAPLMNFSFADCNLLNRVCIHEKGPKEKNYKVIKVPKEKLTFFTTQRNNPKDIFSKFSNILHALLRERYGSEYGEIVNFDLPDYLKDDFKRRLSFEIPDEDLQLSYLENKNIWDKDWCDAQKE